MKTPTAPSKSTPRARAIPRLHPHDPRKNAPMNAMSANFLTDHTATRHRRNTRTPTSATHSGPACGSNSVTGHRWYCWKSHPKAETIALRELRAQGFEAYLPRFMVRRDGEQEVIRPMFPSYGFVSFDRSAHRWRAIHSTRGIALLFSAGPLSPIPVPRGVVEDLQARARPDGVIDETYAGPEFEPLDGMLVRITEGPFADLEGLCRWSNAKRIAILLDVMGGRIETQINRADAVPV